MTEHFGDLPYRNWKDAMLKGLKCRCPKCGKGKVFNGFLKVRTSCAHCDEALHHHRADDLPAYITMAIVAHVVVALMLNLNYVSAPSDGLQIAIFVPLTIVLSIALIRPIKGAVVGLQWALYMHGFSPDGDYQDPGMPAVEPAAVSKTKDQQ